MFNFLSSMCLLNSLDMYSTVIITILISSLLILTSKFWVCFNFFFFSLFTALHDQWIFLLDARYHGCYLLAAGCFCNSVSIPELWSGMHLFQNSLILLGLSFKIWLHQHRAWSRPNFSPLLRQYPSVYSTKCPTNHEACQSGWWKSGTILGPSWALNTLPSNLFVSFPCPWIVSSPARASEYLAEYLSRSPEFSLSLLFGTFLVLPDSQLCLPNPERLMGAPSLHHRAWKLPLKTVIWGNLRSHLICFQALGDHCPLLSGVQRLENNCFIQGVRQGSF